MMSDILGLRAVDTVASTDSIEVVRRGTDGRVLRLKAAVADIGSAGVTLDTEQTITAVKTMSGANIITHAPTGLILQDSDASNVVTIAAGDESDDRTLSIPVLAGDDTVMTLATAQTVSGVKTYSAANIFSVMPRIPATTVAALGVDQSDAAAITTGFTLVSGADDAKGVKLPAAAAGLVCIIKVGDGADLKVWPNTGDAINALGANNALTVVDDVCFALIALDATTWYTLPLLPS
jgi:hypothetical protein